MKTFEFKSERNWHRVYDVLDNNRECKFTTYGYKAITVCNEMAENELIAYCKAHRISAKEI